jgi:hypothetical protein
VQHRLLAADHERVPGIGSTRVAHDQIGVLRVDVDDLAFAFIAPLGADHHDHGHDFTPSRVLGP